jgi:hypothetical protein
MLRIIIYAALIVILNGGRFGRACLVVRDHNGQQLAYVYFEDVFEVPTVQSRPIPGAK